MKIVYQYATLEDVLEISRLMATTCRTSYQGMFSDQVLNALTDDRWVAVFTQRLSEGKPILIANVDGKIAAATTYGPARRSDYTGMGEVYSLYVLPEFQGQGIGKQILELAMEDLEQDTIYILAASNNVHARNFYESMGFAWNGQVIQGRFADADFEEVVYIKSKT